MSISSADNTTVGLLEVDPSGARLSWVFPSLSSDDSAVRVLASRAQLLAPALPLPLTFSFCRIGGTWYYSLARDRKADGEAADVVHPAVSRLALFLGAATFHPERYEALLHVLMRAFQAEGGSPLALLQRVLSVSTKGTASAPGGDDFAASKFGSGLAEASLAALLSQTVRRVGAAPCATLWAAMMLRSRVAVYKEHDASSVLSLVRTLPLLAWHRKRWEVLIPVCGLELPEEVAELQAAGTFAAGFTDPAILERPELYDALPPAAVRAKLEAALTTSGVGLLAAIERATAELLERARGMGDGGNNEETAFLRRLLDAEGIGAGA